MSGGLQSFIKFVDIKIGWGRVGVLLSLTIIAVAIMVAFHLFIISTFPLAVPVEWNALFAYAVIFLFLGFPNWKGYGLTDMSPWWLAVVIFAGASAIESATQIYQLQVWDDTTGQKLGESAPGTASIKQAFSLAPGTHQIIVEDIGTGTFQTLHQASVNLTVLADGVFIASPLNNMITAAQVTVSASARESTSSIWQLQVWDKTTGIKLGESAPGTSAINQTFALAPGRRPALN